jgi:hypothetical protein
MEHGQLHHIEYYVRNLVRSNELWGWLLPLMGYSQFQCWEKGISWRHSNGTYIVFVELSADDAAIKSSRHGTGMNHLALMSKDSKQFEALQQGLACHRARVLKVKPGYICFEDPNEFAVEIYFPTEQ